MSYQRDYILRMIAMMAELIAGILGLIKKGEFGKASEAIEQVYYDMLKEDAAFFRKLPLENLTDSLIQEHNYTHDHLEILAELFFADAELEKARNNKGAAFVNYQKSHSLLQFLSGESGSFSIEKQNRIMILENEISQLSHN